MAVTTQQFIESLWLFFDEHGRHDLPWRQPLADGTFDAYQIVVSEIMLQQTQVARVIPKYQAFLRAFPTVSALAQAPLADVLQLWSGLGYNRRARFLWLAAQQVMRDYEGVFPSTVAELVTLPGIGRNTAGAVMSYAYNQPVVFIETNVRTVFIHYFFDDHQTVADSLIIAQLEAVLDHEHPREFYWALMDLGSYIKQTIGNASQRSASYKKQSAFEGSRRQLRGAVLRALAGRSMTMLALGQELPDERLAQVLQALIDEQLVQFRDDNYFL